jgi:hypothetical protein
MINGYIFTSLASAQACQAAVDAALGYPRVGVNVGAGVHVPPFTTQTYAAPVQNFADAAQWAYVADGITSPVLAPNAVTLGLPAPTAIAATWYAPVAVGS